MTFQPESLLCILPVYQSLLFAVIAKVLYHRSGGNHRQVLSLFMLVSGLWFVLNCIYVSKHLIFLSIAVYLSLPVWLLLMPVFYLWIKSLMDPDYSVRWNDGKHFLPALTGLLLMIPWWLGDPAERMDFILQKPDLDFWRTYVLWIYRVAVFGAFAVQFAIYAFYFSKRYPGYIQLVKNYHSNPDAFRLTWLRWIIVFFLISYLAIDLIHLTGKVNHGFYRMEFNVLMLILNLGIGLFGISQPAGLTPAGTRYFQAGYSEENAPPVTEPAPSARSRYKKPLLKPEGRDQLLRRLKENLNNERSFLNPDLTIDDLARTLGTNSKYLSQAINEGEGVSFSTLINRFRIQEAINMLTHPEYRHYSVEGVFSSCGFQSKTTFLQAFRKIMGCTPSEYRNQVK